ncbi:hypothetical protein ACFWAM_46305, partial [Rhodococcus jostii]
MHVRIGLDGRAEVIEVSAAASLGAAIWAEHRIEARGWNPRHRQGSRADRTLETVEVMIPPMIGALDC